MEREDSSASYISSPYSTVGRTWAMLCAPAGTEDTADEVDITFAGLAILCGNALGHLSENATASTWYRLLRIAGSPAHSDASTAVARMAWWLYVASGGTPGMADTLVTIPDQLERRRMLEAVAMWQRDAPDDLAHAGNLLERHLLNVVAEDFQVRQLTDDDASRAEWVNILSNLSEIADVIMRSDVRRGYLKRMYSAPGGVLS